MTFRNILAAVVLVSAGSLGLAQAQTQDPSIDQVYQAANSGHVPEALSMMGKVLQNHPNSAKAHYVEADLLAKQGRLSEARTELSTAERLEPGLPGVNAAAVQELRSRLYGGNAVMPVQRAPARSGIPFGMIFIFLLVIAFIVLIARAFGRRNTVVYGPGGAAPGFGPAAGMPGYGPGYGPGGYPMGGMGGGIGSGILGGLATGAAVGAGVVAGEELMHHFTDGDRGTGYVQPTQDVLPPDNIGGNDFGINDTSSWDNGSGGGSWDSGSSDMGGGGGDWT